MAATTQPGLEHIPVLLDETLINLMHSQTGTYVDATFGRGGHARAILERLDKKSRLVAFDQDPQAVAVGQEMAQREPRLEVHQGRFSQLAQMLGELTVPCADGVLMDIGVSSPQLDDPARGFSFRSTGPLDMRMDPSMGVSAAQWLDDAEEVEIAKVIRQLGEERFARRIAHAIVQARPLATTQALAELVAEVIPTGSTGKRHPATKTFQALRIYVNDELGELRKGIDAAFSVLCDGGRLAVISFHSLEDRIVKQRFRDLTNPPQLPRRLPVRTASVKPPARSIAGPVKPGIREQRGNPRARSAILRVIEKVGAHG